MNQPLLLFVYGSLKSGYWNWPAHGANAQASGPGYVPGRLWLRQPGTPIFQPDPAYILHKGTESLADDLALQTQLTSPELMAEFLENHEIAYKDFLNQTPPETLQKDFVLGEWLLFENGEEALRKLDQLEEFFPKKVAASLYDRYLLQSPALRAPIWAFTIPENGKTADYRIAKNPHCWDSKTEGVMRDPKTGVFLAF